MTPGVSALRPILLVEMMSILYTFGETRQLRFGFCALFSECLLLLGGTAMEALTRQNVVKGLLERSTPAQVAVAASPMSDVVAGGIRAIYADYKETLFDWPQKMQPQGEPRCGLALEKLRAL